MAGQVEFRIEGAKEMERVLKQLGPNVAARVGDAALRAGAKPIVEEAKRLAPARSGELRDNIKAQIERRRKGDDERVILIGFDKSVSYRAHFVEFGTSKMPAKPFMRPAMDAMAGEALSEMGRVLARGITREARKLAKPAR